MKKLFLPLFVLAISNIYAQNNKIGTCSQKPKADKEIAPTGNEQYNYKKLRSAFPSLVGTKEVVGGTSYDLQTNGCMPRRVVQTGNRVSCAWTLSKESSVTSASAFADRGSGYAHFDGAAWSAQPSARIENLRTGFGSLAIDGSGNEVYAAHSGTANIILNRKVAGVWTSTTTSLVTTNNALWPSMATAGNWMYIVASSQDSATKSNGIRNGYFFSRSNDNGATWINNMIPMPLIDSTTNWRGGGNSYSISARGNYVSIAFGDVGTDLTILTSSDNGTTWTKKTAWDWPINNYDFAGTVPSDYNADGIVDTLFTNDGSHSLVIDAQGVSHVAFPLFRVFKVGGAGNTGYNFFWGTQLAYYNTFADSAVSLDNSFSIFRDCDGDGAFGLGDNHSGALATDPDAMYATIGMITSPSISIISGTPNKVAIAYTALMDSDTTIDDGVHNFWFGSSSLTGQNYRDVFVTVSPDNGVNWSNFPVNISKTAHYEEMFVSTPEFVSSGDAFNVFYQGDIEPGTILQNEDIYDFSYQNFMICQKVSIAELITLGNDSVNMCGQVELPLNVTNNVAGVGKINVYPNPSTNFANVDMHLTNTVSNVTIEMTDVTGALVYSTKLQNVKDVVSKIPVSNLSNGIYVITVSTNNGKLTQKFVKN